MVMFFSLFLGCITHFACFVTCGKLSSLLLMTVAMMNLSERDTY